MTDKSEDAESSDPTIKLSCLISFSVEELVRNERITPDAAIRAIASAFWATVVAYSSSEHFEANSQLAVEIFEACRSAAAHAQKELEFDGQHEGAQWGTA